MFDTIIKNTLSRNNNNIYSTQKVKILYLLVLQINQKQRMTTLTKTIMTKAHYRKYMKKNYFTYFNFLEKFQIHAH